MNQLLVRIFILSAHLNVANQHVTEHTEAEPADKIDVETSDRTDQPGGKKTKKEATKWDEEADTALVEQLVTLKKDEGVSSENGFKETHWQTVVEKVAGSEERTGGASKDKEACRGRFYKVRNNLR